MSDYLIINGESLEVEKKFDKCAVEGFGNTTEDISTNTIIVPVGDTPGPTPPVDPFSGAWDLINNIPQLTSSAKEEIITTIQENIDGFENWLATSDGRQIVFTKDQNFCFVKSYSECYATFGYKNTDAFPLILFFCNSSGTAVVERIIAPTSGMLMVGDFQVCWVERYYPSPEILYGSSMSTNLSANSFTLSASIQSYYVADGRFGYSTGWSLSEVETSYDPDPPGPEPSIDLSDTVQVIAMKYFYTQPRYVDNEDPKVDALFKNFISSGSDQRATLYTYTADEDCYIVIDKASRTVCNASGNDGYIELLQNSTSLYKTYVPSAYDNPGSYKTMSDLEVYEISAGDTFTIVCGYDNSHTAVYHYLYWAVAIIKK